MPDTAPDFDLRAYLRGSWSVDRTLLDRSTGTSGTFTGVVRFTDLDDGGLMWREEGTVRWTSFSGAPFTGPASREYLLRTADTPDTLDVYFPDGRPFHRMGFAGQANRDVHWCDPDTYRVRYQVLGPDECGYRWDVTGPAKDQLLESVLHRLKAGPEAGPDAAPDGASDAAQHAVPDVRGAE
ncbi:DUF6314 family protein [Arthrobacter sp. NPDC058130]|uniref:DUF6314 family protein n=1 Tax=Arthrobacter sp. NPDC058130 TaxID=3346353 RepID=UPI0036EE5DEC